MPAIIVNSLELTEEQKTIIAEEYTNLFATLTKVPKEKIYVFFAGYPLADAAAGGQLFSSHPPTGIVGQFNKDD